jgi:hypothetical protein
MNIRRVITLIAVLITAGLGGLDASAGSVPGSPGPILGTSHVPILAFYYIWFDAGSWDRAKIDYPAVGRYSSDDPTVIRGQIQAAKGAGIDGFIVSWKSTPTNNRRLRLLMTIAAQEDFKLAMIYQGLDFNRNPLPTDRVAADFVLFRDTFAQDPVFLRMGGKPLTIFSGSWAFDHDAVSRVTTPVRTAMVVLSTEKSIDGYRRLADVTDGDAYYWSSVDPDTHPGYPEKLNAMSQAIHADGKMWIAPFSPGFDARLVGGTKTVERKDGQTMITQYRVAERSSPDALGLISWNEFSENTYVEPSDQFGDRYLTVLRQLVQGEPAIEPPAEEADTGDSSSSSGSAGDFVINLILLTVFATGLLTVVGILARRKWKDPWPPDQRKDLSQSRGQADVLR